MADEGPRPRYDSAGRQLCQLCPVRLNRANGKLYLHPPGHICQSCHNRMRKGEAAAASGDTPAAPKPSRKRRAQSDPGELPAHATPPALTRRVTPPSPVPASKKLRVTRQEERIMRLLDETHARRMAAEAVEAAAPAAAEGAV